MSFFSNVGKTFKKVFSNPVTAIAATLAIGAIIFTGGAALGLAPLGIAGGWGAAASSLFGSMGATGTLGTLLTGAVTQAGYGAVLGGVLGAVTGGSDGLTKGLTTGAIAGGLAGGVMGGLGMATDPLAGAFGAASESAGGVALPSVANADALAPGAGFQAAGATPPPTGFTTGLNAALPAPTPLLPGMASSGPAGAVTGKTVGTGLSGWIERHPTLVGSAVSGLGQGLAGAASAGDETDAINAEYDRIDANYKVGPGALTRYEPGASKYQTPEEKYGRSGGSRRQSARTRRRFRYDPAVGRVVQVETA